MSYIPDSIEHMADITPFSMEVVGSMSLFINFTKFSIRHLGKKEYLKTGTLRVS